MSFETKVVQKYIQIATSAGEPFYNSTNSKRASWGSRMSDPGRTRPDSPACSLQWRAWWKRTKQTVKHGFRTVGWRLHSLWRDAGSSKVCSLTCRPGLQLTCSSFPCTRDPWGSRLRDIEGSVSGPAGSRELLSHVESVSCSNYLLTNSETFFYLLIYFTKYSKKLLCIWTNKLNCYQ